MSSVRHRDRAALGAQLRMSAAIAATVWVAMWSWRGFTVFPGYFLGPLALVAVVVAGTGALARWRRLPGVVVLLLQAVVGGAVTCQVVASRPYPGARFRELLSAAVDAANTYASPVPRTDEISVQPLLIVGGFVAVLLVDLCAGTLRRVPLAGLPLLTVYSVPISLIDRGLSWGVFTATAVGFLFMLFLQEEEHLSRWGRSLDGNTEPVRRLSGSVRGSALTIGAVATAAAVLVPAVIPTFNLSVFDLGPGGGGNGDITVTNPMVDLRQDLVRGPDSDLITVRTDGPRPRYLRISVLNRFTDNEWSAGNRDVPSANLAQGPVPLDPTDPSLVSYDSVDYDLDVADAFDSKWLPTQAPISSIQADEDWRFDASTLDFIAGDTDLTTSGIDYSMTAEMPTYDAEAVLGLDTTPQAVPGDLTDLPDDLPGKIRDYTLQATAGATTDFQRAVLLTQFFRDEKRFTYDIPSENSNEGPVGTDQLVDFLDPDNPQGRKGYCEQFSAAMAVMARQLDIPARIAVGFLQADPVPGSSDTYVFSAHDLHAWVELYFPRAGWVRFDPTPAARSGAQPAYAEQEVGGDEPLPTQTSAPTTAPTSQPTRPSASASPPPRDVTPPAAAQPQDEGGSFPWRVLLIVVGAALLVLLLVLGPRTLRRRQRERRLTGGPEAAWEELRATAVDLRLTWPEGRSPRETGDVVAAWFGAPDGGDVRPAQGPDLAPAAAAALDRLVGRLERVRYSRSYAVAPGSMRDDVLLVGDAMAAGATPRLRRRARWLPVSVFQRRRIAEAEAGAVAAAEPELVGGRSEML